MINWDFLHQYGFLLFKDRVQVGMESDGNDPTMGPDEIYLMLQADMISIKRQEQTLQSEIDDIAAKFHQLLESCGIEPSHQLSSGTMAPPSTPSFLKSSNASLTQVTSMGNFETPTFLKASNATELSAMSDSSDSERDNDSMLHMLSLPVFSLTNSQINTYDGLPQDLSSKTLLIDSNSNYLESPHSEATDTTPMIEALPILEAPDSSESFSTSQSGSHSSKNETSSEGYPKSSDDSSDNQIVPECYDLDKEFMSRLQYYSDFTIDRQKKINSMVSHIQNISKPSQSRNSSPEEFIRHVEGAESPEAPVKMAVPRLAVQPPSTSGSGSEVSTPNSQRRSQRRSHRRHSNRRISSKPIANSTMLNDSFSSGSSGRHSHRTPSLNPIASSTMMNETLSSNGSSGRRNKTGGSNPRACSTMLDESFLSSGSQGSGRHRSSSLPMANSTMISEPLTPVCVKEISIPPRRSSICTNDDDLESIYTWSIHDEDSCAENLEESYLKSSQKKNNRAGKPPLPPTKRARSGSVSSRDSDCCKDSSLHKLLGESCSKHIMETISAIEPNTSGRDCVLLVDSLYDEEDACLPKCSTIPRSSTKIKLQDKSSGSSSMEARRASLPDLYSVCNSNQDDFHSVPNSVNSETNSEGETSAELRERLECPGKSSSSNDKSISVVKDSLIDSILTDSPNSISSSGLHAPQNSPGTNCSSSSKVSCSTTSEAKSSDSNVNVRAPSTALFPLRHITESPKVQNTGTESDVFKVPKQTQPLRKLFRFKRSKCKTPDLRTSTPKGIISSVHSDPLSKRQLFPKGQKQAPAEPKVMDKKAVIKKFKIFSDNFYKKDKSNKVKIETLANL